MCQMKSMTGELEKLLYQHKYSFSHVKFGSAPWHFFSKHIARVPFTNFNISISEMPVPIGQLDFFGRILLLIFEMCTFDIFSNCTSNSWQPNCVGFGCDSSFCFHPLGNNFLNELVKIGCFLIWSNKSQFIKCRLNSWMWWPELLGPIPMLWCA